MNPFYAIAMRAIGRYWYHMAGCVCGMSSLGQVDREARIGKAAMLVIVVNSHLK